MIDELPLIFTGITMSMIGGGIFYSVCETGFLVEDEFQSKPKALFIFLVSIITANFILVPVLNTVWMLILGFFSIIAAIGILIVFGMIAVNFIVENWNYDDLKSIGIYSFGFLLVIIDIYLL